jgi:Zn-finger nucleic acid-binding protein
MESMTCPQCQSDMVARNRGGVPLAQCTNCEGIFLARIDLGLIIEQENEWHLATGPTTQPIPRIVPGMTAPPEYVPAKQARSYVDELFG